MAGKILQHVVILESVNEETQAAFYTIVEVVGRLAVIYQHACTICDTHVHANINARKLTDGRVLCKYVHTVT